jgi:hypothetical protein
MKRVPVFFCFLRFLVEPSRRRRPVNFCVSLFGGLIAYCHLPKKPFLPMEWVLPQRTFEKSDPIAERPFFPPTRPFSDTLSIFLTRTQ